MGAVSGAIFTSLNVFQAPHEGQRPNHFTLSCPQFSQTYAVFALAYTFERAFSALSIINFRSAKEGLASTFKNSGSRAAVNAVCILWLLAAAAGCILLSPVLGAVVVGCGVAAYLLCVAVIFKTFGGMSGDLAGWLLQVIELLEIITQKILGNLVSVYPVLAACKQCSIHIFCLML